MLLRHILCYKNANTESVIYDSCQNDNGSIGRVDLWWPHFIEIEEKRISYRASMLKYILVAINKKDRSNSLQDLTSIYSHPAQGRILLYL